MPHCSLTHYQSEVREQELEIGGKSLVEVAYGWTDTGNLRR
jgi:hypothetical protein